MSRIKWILLSAVVVFALSAMTAQAAFAADPTTQQEFEKVTPGAITSKGGEGVLTAGNSVVKCKKEEDTSKLKNKWRFEKVEITFKECKSENKTTGCKEIPINSKNEPKESGLIKTNPLEAELGEIVLPSTLAGKPAIIFEGVGTEQIFVELEGNGCTETAKVIGKELCEIKELTSTTGEVNCPKTRITEVERSKGDATLKFAEDEKVKNTLEAFGAKATEVQKSETTGEANKLLVGA